MGDRTGVDLTVISPSHPNGAAALLLGDVCRQDAVAEHSVVKVQVALLLLVHLHSDCCSGKSGAHQETEDLVPKSNDWTRAQLGLGWPLY